MRCPVDGHGEMELYDSNPVKNRYCCKVPGCSIMLDKGTAFGNVLAVGGAALTIAVTVGRLISGRHHHDRDS